MNAWERHLARLAAIAIVCTTLGLGVWGIVDWYLWRFQVTSAINAIMASKTPPGPGK